jgi:hypothetical protein
VDLSNIDRLFQYALAAASQADDFKDRELGPIHLLKYAYLGDLAHARAHGGQTFTSAPWKFHHFGPWAVEAWKRLPGAMITVKAQERRFSSHYQKDNVRWKLESTVDPDSVVPGVPVAAALAIRRAVGEFGSDTVSLLDHVYKTPPMLRAAPGEFLSFEPAPDVEGREQVATAPSAAVPVLSKAKLKKLKQRVRERLQQGRARRLVDPTPPPRYDAVFEDGLEWLDRLGGEPLEQTTGVLRFSEEVWKSKGRRETDFP